MNKPHIGDSFTAGFDFVKKNPGPAIVGAFAMNVIGGVTYGVLGGPVILGFYSMVARFPEGGEPGYDGVFKGFKRFWPSVSTYLLGAVLTMIGLCFCIVPGLLVFPMVYIAMGLVHHGADNAVEAYKRAWQIHKGNLLMNTAAIWLFTLFQSLGILLCFVGIFFTAPVATAAITFYVEALLADGTDESAPTEKSDPDPDPDIASE